VIFWLHARANYLNLGNSQKDVLTFLLESPSFYLKTLGPFSPSDRLGDELTNMGFWVEA